MFEQRKIDGAIGRATKLAKDGVYLTVGLVVVTTQKAQELWQDYVRQLEAGLASSKEQVATMTAKVEPVVKAVDERFTSLEARLGEVVERSGDTLPDPAAKAFETAFEASKSARAQMFQFVMPAPKAA